MPSFHGTFVWYELMTTDMAAAETFYKNVVGWDAHDSGMPGMSYTILTADGAGIGGMMTLPKEACDAGARPGWMGYIGVEDVDRYTDQVAKAGGTIHRPPMDIPEVGRFSVVADPQGAMFALLGPKGQIEA
ncbi:MAG: VOC family protein [Acetobacteraceae bacterium]|nr:VOC family protein [Acetobacteraceae bacterium]